MADEREKVWDDTWISQHGMTSNEPIERAPYPRAEAEKIRKSYDAGLIDIDSLEEPEREKILTAIERLEQAEAFERMKGSTVPAGQPEVAAQSVTVAPRGMSASHLDTLPHPRKSTPRPVAADNEDLYRATLFESWLSGKSTIESAATVQEEAQVKEPEVLVTERASIVNQQDIEDAKASLSDVDLMQDPAAVQAEIEAIAELLKKGELEGKEIPDFTLFSILGEGDVTDDVARRLAVNGKVREMVQKIYEDMGWSGWLVNVAGWFVPGKQIKDNVDYTGSVFNATEFASNLINNFRSLSPEEQEAYLPVLQEDLLKELPELRAAQVLEALTSPTGQEDIQDFHVMWAAMDAAELAYIGGKLLQGSFKMFSRYRIINQIRDELKNTAITADSLTTAAIAKSDNAAAALGMDRESLVNSIVGLKGRDIDGTRVQRVSAESIDRIEKYDEKVREFTKSIDSSASRNAEGFITPKERAEIEYRKMEDLRKQTRAEEIEIVDRDHASVTFKYEAFDESGTSLGEMTYKAPIGLDDIDPLQLNVSGLVGQALRSPLSWLKGEGRDLVKSAERIDSQKAMMVNELRSLYREAMAPVLGKSNLGALTPSGKKAIERLNKVLLQGDTDSKIYTPEELRAGVAGVKITSEAEIESYYNIRTLVESLLNIRNFSKRREFQIRGYKGIRAGQENLVAKPSDSAASARGAIQETGAKMYYNISEGKAVSLDTLDLEKAYNDGWVLSRLPEYTDVGGAGNKVKFVLTRAEDVTDVPLNLIPRREGYIPKINLDGAYFVKKRTAQIIDGEAVDALSSRAAIKTERAFSNRTEAEEFLARKVKEAAAKGEDPTKVSYEVLSDRELEKERALSFAGEDAGVAGSGGLFTGQRSTDDILFGLEGVKGDRLDAFTALSRNLSSIGKYVPTNEWRLGLERKALETANMLTGKGNKVYRSFEQLSLAPLDTPNGKIIRGLHKQINDWKGIPTTEELLFQEQVQGIIDSAFGRNWLPKGAVSALHNLKANDPVAAMRAAAFHGLLGWFNPVQLWVQAQGSIVAASMNIFNPAMLARNLGDQFFLRVVQDVEFTPAMAKHMAKSLDANEKELVELFTAWKRSGLQDSVLVNADYAAAAKGHGVALEALSRASESGLMFYREGELFNRRFSFSTAYNEWKQANKGKELTDEALQGIVDRANDFMLNMGKANRAAWQRGVMGLPTQFMQVTAKTIESLLGLNNNFTLKERGKILAGQAAMYGAAGLPLGNLGSIIVAQWLGYDTQEKVQKVMSPETRKALNEGFLGWLLMSITGVDMAVGSRSALLNGSTDFLNDLFFSESTLAETLSGAFGSVGGGFWSGLSGQYVPLSMGRLTNGEVNWATKFSAPFIGSIATLRNIDKAVIMAEHNKIVDKNLNPIIAREFTLGEQLVTAAGFQLTDVQEIYSINAMNAAPKKAAQSVGDILAKHYFSAALYAKDGQLTPEKALEIGHDSAKLIQTLPTPKQRQMAMQRLQSKLTNMNTKEGRAWREFMELHAEGYVNTMGELSKALRPSFLGGDPGQLRGIFGGMLVQDEQFQGQEVAQ